MGSTRLASLTYHPLTVPLKRSFGIAGGTQEVAQNVLIRLVLGDGTMGIGESAPFPAASGETFESTMTALASVEEILRRSPDLSRYRAVSAELAQALRGAPAALAGVEIALFDALSRQSNRSMLSLFGGAEGRLHTDITVVTGSPEEARMDARAAAASGFETLKIKVGAGDVDEDVRRLRAVLEAAPRASLLLDANGAYSPEEALTLLSALGGERSRIALFEQPVAADDLDGLRQVEREGRVRVAADESLRSREDFKRLVKGGGISAINIKVAKLGVVAAWDLLIAAQAAGLSVMIGGMVETELSMTASACLAAGVGHVEFVDLDTPLFMGPRPLSGGFVQSGPLLDLASIELGHGVAYSGRLVPSGLVPSVSLA